MADPSELPTKATLYDVANRAGVSPKSVSRVLNDSPNLSAEMRARVQRAIAELSYHPNPIARLLRVGRDHSIGVIVDSLADPFFASVVDVLNAIARLHGNAPLLVGSTGGVADREVPLVRDFARRNIGGLILVPCDDDQSYLSEINNEMPVVLIDRVGRQVALDTVRIDDEAAADNAVTHLIMHGHTRIALIGDIKRISTAARRADGYRRALARHKIDPDPDLEAECLAPDDARSAVLRMLQLREPPTAIFSSNAKSSLGVIPALQRSHRTDIALVCFGDTPLADAFVPGITVVDQDPADIGEIAARLLIGRMTGDRKGPPEEVLVPTKLIPRGSGELPVPVQPVTRRRSRHGTRA